MDRGAMQGAEAHDEIQFCSRTTTATGRVRKDPAVRIAVANPLKDIPIEPPERPQRHAAEAGEKICIACS
jgi:hypothetical protein